MGASLNSDNQIKIYMTLEKRIYYAGETIKGSVHIICKVDRPYRFVRVKFEGREEVEWDDKQKGREVTNYNKRDTYDFEFMLTKFDLGIKAGQYSFPFSFLLPSSLPASYSLDEHNYINYKLHTFMPQYDEKSQNQTFTRQLHLREPPREIPRPLKVMGMVESKCCRCCCSCGFSNLMMQSDSTFLNNGQSFHLDVTLQNTNGSQSIKGFKLILQQQVKRVSSRGHSITHTDDLVIYSSKQGVKAGKTENFKVQVKIPTMFKGYTAIGNIIYRAYFLVLSAQVGCCCTNPSIRTHIILNSNVQPRFNEKEEGVPAPANWDPVVAVPLEVNALKPFMYTPMEQIQLRNQGGKVVQESEMMMSRPPESMSMSRPLESMNMSRPPTEVNMGKPQQMDDTNGMMYAKDI